MWTHPRHFQLNSTTGNDHHARTKMCAGIVLTLNAGLSRYILWLVLRINTPTHFCKLQRSCTSH